ncbi:hypothetical protein R6138_01895 [Ralstonia thomasii]|uniref:hypothetical protein n=1 Tax=Ralstonia thomasii TaxID=3058596 RepID=UPI0028F4EAA6|nr:hypothetical protein [Ralstonia sp. LMG 18095]CAJ0873057.1 hypothetical protein R6138_01895 [Ralstonia sp. LMG 18095]
MAQPARQAAAVSAQHVGTDEGTQVAITVKDASDKPVVLQMKPDQYIQFLGQFQPY